MYFYRATPMPSSDTTRSPYRPSHTDILSKLLYALSRNHRRIAVHGLFLAPNILTKIQRGSPHYRLLVSWPFEKPIE